MTTLDISDLIAAATPDDFQAKILSVATLLGLPTTAWQSGGITRTIVAVLSQILGVTAGTPNTTLLAGGGTDGLVATINRGGFLKLASAVTPDPSVDIANEGGWLDIVADSVFNVTREGATYATGPMTLTNAAAVPYGPFAPGTYHIANPTTGKSFANSAALTIGASGNTTATFVADVAGAASTSAASAITTTVTSLVGVSIVSGSQSGVLTGTNAESNALLVQRCLDKLQALGPQLGPGGAYRYFATTATQPVADGGGGLTLAGGAITRVGVVGDTLTGFVYVTIANANGGQPPRLPAGDVTIIDTYLQGVCVPSATTLFTQGAAESDLTVSLTVLVPAANASTAVADVRAAIATYLQTLPIGGIAMDAVINYGVPYDGVMGAIFRSVTYVTEVRALLLNGGSADIVLTNVQVAINTVAATVTVVST